MLSATNPSSEDLNVELPGIVAPRDSSLRYFGVRAVVEWRGDGAKVFVDGLLIGEFSKSDPARRNALLVGITQDANVHFGKLARAFDLTSEALRLIRRQYETEGIQAVVARRQGGPRFKITPAQRQRLHEMFDEGFTIDKAHARFAKRCGLSRATVGLVRRSWAQGAPKTSASVHTGGLGATTTTPAQSELELSEASSVLTPIAPPESSPPDARPVSTEGGAAPEEIVGARVRIPARALRGGRHVQHAGTWLMMAMVARLGLYECVQDLRGPHTPADALRIALDAVIAALSLGERCVEGVRRLATPTAPILLRARGALSASWARRVLGSFSANGNGVLFHFRFGVSLLRTVAQQPPAREQPVVLYLDNHMRPYSGQHTLRFGWRMQEKRALPGASDYYLHDEDGRPLLRRFVPDNASLTSILRPMALLVRQALEADRRFLFVFDRAGAFPAAMAELRDDDAEFVTYERGPCTDRPASEFCESFKLDGDKIGIAEAARKNLGSGRGRLRRISLRMPDGHQVHLLAHSEESAEWLARKMRARWQQENAFKHGVERWGINQLDSRTVVAYPPDTVIPNPARRKLDRALRIAQTAEGDLRRKLARLAAGTPKHTALEARLVEAAQTVVELEAQRPQTPLRETLAKTQLAGDLVHHTAEYKATIDALRVACANAESQLAAELGVALRRPGEAKRVLRNVLAAPADVRVTARAIHVALAPAANVNERVAIARLLSVVNSWDLHLPGDDARRPLRFESQVI